MNHNDHLRRASMLLGLVLATSLWPIWASAQDGWVSNSAFFDVDTHGWPFKNDPQEFIEWLKGTFAEISPAWTVCGGMSLSAKRRFLADIPIEDFSESVKQELKDGQVETVLGDPPVLGGGNWARFIEWQAKPDYPHTFAAHTIGYSTKQEWPKVKTSIDMGFPVVLGLIRVGPTKAVWDVGNNHQVLAIGYRYMGNLVEIIVYDPNHPRGYVTVSMNFGLPDNRIDAKQSTSTIGTLCLDVYRDLEGQLVFRESGSMPPPQSVYLHTQCFEYETEKVRGFFVVDDSPRCQMCDVILNLSAVSSPVPLGYGWLPFPYEP